MKTKPRYFMTIGAVSGIYIVTAMIGLYLAFGVNHVITLGPPAAVALAALYLYGSEIWPGVFLGAITVNIGLSEQAGAALIIALGCTLEAVVGAIVLKRAVNFKPALNDIRSVLGLIVVAAVLSTMIGVTIGTVGLGVTGQLAWSDLPSVWLLGWGCGMASILLIAPFIFVWNDGWRKIGRGRRTEFVGLLIGTAIIASLVFFWEFKPQGRDPEFEYLIFPFIIWAAFKFKQLGVTALILLTSLIAAIGTQGGSGPFTQFGDRPQQFVALFNMVIVSISGMFLAVAVLQREFYELGLVRNAEELRLARDNIMIELNAGAENQVHLADSNERITKILGQLLNDKPGQPFPRE